MWRNILCHAFIQIIILIVLIFVIPGWLVYDYEILQTNLDFKTINGEKICEGFYQKSENTCSLLNPFFASEVYQNSITIESWKVLKATQDTDYD